MNFLDNLEELETMENKILVKFNKAEMESKKLEPLTKLLCKNNVPGDIFYPDNPTNITDVLKLVDLPFYMPYYTTNRHGMSYTDMSGVSYFIGGEHEDYYDPAFCIYNDVIKVENDKITIYGYPREDFPPTDFHSAEYHDNKIWIFGSIGYPEHRKEFIQVLVLDLETMKMENVHNNSGPLWTHFKEPVEILKDGLQGFVFDTFTKTWKSTN